MKTQVLSPNSYTLDLARAYLQEGQVVGIPTETVYGLAGNAFDEQALLKIFKAKERPTFDPLIVHVPLEWNSIEALETNQVIDLKEFSDLARSRVTKLMQAFWPGPLTIVLPKDTKIPDLVTSGLGTVGVRMPRHPVTQELLRTLGFPLAAPSANRFGRISPTAASHVEVELGGRIPLILDAGPCEIGIESTVLHVAPNGTLTLLRPGGVLKEEIESCVDAPVEIMQKQYSTMTSASPTQKTSFVSPGLLASHYAPSKPLEILPESVEALTHEKLQRELKEQSTSVVGLLVFQGSAEKAAEEFSRWIDKKVIARSLSSKGSMDEAAQKLFAELRALDESSAQMLFVEPCPHENGLGHAIFDRLSRAAAPRH